MVHLSGNVFDYFWVFWAGVLVSFTPCVYPVMPITAGLIAGANTRGTKVMGFWLSLIYVLGMAVTYSILAVAAALTGKIFGQWQNSPWVYLVVANLLLFFALVMADVIPLPAWGAGMTRRARPGNAAAVFVFGMTAGLVVGPCTAPVLGTLLLYAASRHHVLHAASLLFVFAYGLGASLILIGTFSGLLGALPKSGPWLVRVKQLTALVLLAAAEYFLIKAGMAWV